MLEGENPAAIPPDVMRDRVVERYRQLRAKARSAWDLDVVDWRRAVRAVFDSRSSTAAGDGAGSREP